MQIDIPNHAPNEWVSYINSTDWYTLEFRGSLCGVSLDTGAKCGCLQQMAFPAHVYCIAHDGSSIELPVKIWDSQFAINGYGFMISHNPIFERTLGSRVSKQHILTPAESETMYDIVLTAVPISFKMCVKMINCSKENNTPIWRRW